MVAVMGAYHIGIYAIYSLVAFLFVSGTIKYRPLQALSLFIAFVYGSMIWGTSSLPVFLGKGTMGLIVGVILAIIYRKKDHSDQNTSEIEKELGIEPPDLEECIGKR